MANLTKATTAALRYLDNSEAVQRAVYRNSRRALFGTGAQTMRRVRWSMKRAPKRGGKVSAPGSPPMVHVGILKRGVQFDVEMDSKTVLVGPDRYKSPYARAGAGLTGAQILEEGGQVLMERQNGAQYMATIRKRPYMEPQQEWMQATFKRFLANDGLTK